MTVLKMYTINCTVNCDIIMCNVVMSQTPVVSMTTRLIWLRSFKDIMHKDVLILIFLQHPNDTCWCMMSTNFKKKKKNQNNDLLLKNLRNLVFWCQKVGPHGGESWYPYLDSGHRLVTLYSSFSDMEAILRNTSPSGGNY